MRKIFVQKRKPQYEESKLLKEYLEKNFEKIVSINDLVIEINYLPNFKKTLRYVIEKSAQENLIRKPLIACVPSFVMDVSLLDLVTRWIDGFEIIIIEENLKKVNLSPKEINGLSFHILGHIEDMEKKDFLTSENLFLPSILKSGPEEIILQTKTEHFLLEFEAEKIAIEKGNPSHLLELRKKLQEISLKKIFKELSEIKHKKVKIHEIGKKEYFFYYANMEFLGISLAWMKSSQKKLYEKEIENRFWEKINEKIEKFDSKKKEIITSLLQKEKKHFKEIQDNLLKVDLTKKEKVIEKLKEIISN